MSISSHHSINIDLDKEFIMIKCLVKSFESKIKNGVEKYGLLLNLKDLRDRLYDFQMNKFGYYIDHQVKIQTGSSSEEKLIAEVLDLENRIDSMMREV